MPRGKMKFNKKLLSRYTRKELLDKMKLDNIPLERPISKYRKQEVVVYLLRLQRSKVYNNFFEKLEIKGPRQLSEKQKLNLQRFSKRLTDANVIMKQQVPNKSKIDKKKDIEFPSRKKETIKLSPTSEDKFLKVKGTGGEFIPGSKSLGDVTPSELDDLFVFSNEALEKAQKQLKERIGDKKEDDINLPSDVVDIIVEGSGRVESDYSSLVFDELTINEIKLILNEVGISFPKRKKKSFYVNLVASNKTKTFQLVNKKIKQKQQQKEQKETGKKVSVIKN